MFFALIHVTMVSTKSTVKMKKRMLNAKVFMIELVELMYCKNRRPDCQKLAVSSSSHSYDLAI